MYKASKQFCNIEKKKSLTLLRLIIKAVLPDLQYAAWVLSNVTEGYEPWSGNLKAM